MIYLVILCLISSITAIDASLINTATGIEYLLYTEDVFIESFELFFQEQEQQLTHLKTLFNSLEFSHHRTQLSVTLENFTPLDRFRLIKRLFKEWPSFLHVVQETQAHTTKVLDYLSQLVENSNYLEESNEHTSAETIFKAQETYEVTAEQIEALSYEDNVHSPILTHAECYELGYLALLTDRVNISAEWLREVFPRLDESSDEIGFYQEQLENVIVDAYKSGDLYMAKMFTQILSEVVPGFQINDFEKLLVRLNATLDWLKEFKKVGNDMVEGKIESVFTTIGLGEYPEWPDDSQKKTAHENRVHFYRSLCRGDLQPVFQTDTVEPWCLNRNPLVCVGYDKEEVISLDPLIIKFNEFISPDEAEMLILKSKELLTSYKEDENGLVVKISMVNAATLEVAEQSFLEPIDNRIRRVLGLKQANIYHEVVDRGYEESDTFSYYDHTAFDDGDLVGLLLIFLNEPTKGGHTIFPELKWSVKPTEYSAIYWPNDPEKTDWLYQTMDAYECPLLSGFKWYDIVRLFTPKKK